VPNASETTTLWLAPTIRVPSRPKTAARAVSEGSCADRQLSPGSERHQNKVEMSNGPSLMTTSRPLSGSRA